MQAMNEDTRIAELTRKMLRKKLFVLLSKPLVTPERLKPRQSVRSIGRGGMSRSR